MLPDLERLSIDDPSPMMLDNNEEDSFDHWVVGFEQCAEKEAFLIFSRSLRPFLCKTIEKKSKVQPLKTRSMTRPRVRVKTEHTLFLDL